MSTFETNGPQYILLHFIRLFKFSAYYALPSCLMTNKDDDDDDDDPDYPELLLFSSSAVTEIRSGRPASILQVDDDK